jgi:hypothetical protein
MALGEREYYEGLAGARVNTAQSGMVNRGSAGQNGRVGDRTAYETQKTAMSNNPGGSYDYQQVSQLMPQRQQAAPSRPAGPRPPVVTL